MLWSKARKSRNTSKTRIFEFRERNARPVGAVLVGFGLARSCVIVLHGCRSSIVPVLASAAGLVECLPLYSKVVLLVAELLILLLLCPCPSFGHADGK